ncbi:etoposide-induced protein 2.4 homolog [Pecten maximus]|uniref:etoposide-induced protein 2.4 homolog n=1 Tax=Pecten maximus TaxID=6579 RepID=UPI0014589537|nr:etoposide-induced protein 2.4 homolog [Pecten maximus]
MADNFQDILYEIVSGLQDGILGTLKIRKLGKAESEEILKKDPEPMTTLARRRAERNKDKVQHKEREPKIIQRIIMCCAWNGGIFLMSIFLFNHMLLPIVQLIIAGIFGGSGNNSVWGWIGPILSWTFSALWILPIFVLSKVVNSLWFQDIADAAYFQYRGKPKQFNISSLIADISFSMLLQAFFLIQVSQLLSLRDISRFLYSVTSSYIHAFFNVKSYFILEITEVKEETVTLVL